MKSLCNSIKLSLMESNNDKTKAFVHHIIGELKNTINYYSEELQKINKSIDVNTRILDEKNKKNISDLYSEIESDYYIFNLKNNTNSNDSDDKRTYREISNYFLNKWNTQKTSSEISRDQLGYKDYLYNINECIAFFKGSEKYKYSAFKIQSNNNKLCSIMQKLLTYVNYTSKDIENINNLLNENGSN